MRLSNRVKALEDRTPSGPSRWHRILVKGETEHEARSRYELVHGLIPAGDGIIFRSIISPA